MATHVTNDVSRVFAKTQTIAAATILTAADTGKVFFLNAAAGAAVTLPEPEEGLQFKFIVGAAFATTNWTVVAPDNIIQGSCEVAGAVVVGSNENTISFVATAEGLGDQVELISDGTNYFVSGVAALSGGITLTAP